MKMYKLNCISCGYVWSSQSADVCECPMCEGDDIVVLEEMNE